MPDPFARTDSLNDGPILDRVAIASGAEVADGLRENFRTDTGSLWVYQLYGDPENGGTGLFRRLIQVPDGRVVMLYRGWQTWLQPVAPGVFARWIQYPPQDVAQMGVHDWVLWRYEGPGVQGGVRNIAPVDWLLGVQHDTNRQWIWDSYRQPVRSVDTPRGRVWIDGGGMPYGIERPDGWQPTALPVTYPWYFLNGTPASATDWSRSDVTMDDVARDVTRGTNWTSLDQNPGVFLPWTFGAEFFAARARLAFTDAQIVAMRPSEVVKLYYGMGKWVMDDQCPVYESPYWPKPADAPRAFATYSATVEYQLRDRIFALRPDLHQVKLADGSSIPGLISYRTFPPRDGLQCTRKGGTAILAGWAGLVASVLPGVGIWVSLIQFSNQLSDTLAAVETQGKVATFVHDLTTGAKALQAVDAATPNTPAGGNGSPSVNTGKTGISPLLLAGIAAGVLVLATK